MHASTHLDVALGTDLVEVDRIAALVARHSDRFLERVFTQQERAYAATNPKRSAEHLAARFAAKEATLKALGTGLTRGIKWTDVEVRRDNAGQPSIELTGQAFAIAQEQSIRAFRVSLSHTSGHAIATVIALKSELT